MVQQIATIAARWRRNASNKEQAPSSATKAPEPGLFLPAALVILTLFLRPTGALAEPPWDGQTLLLADGEVSAAVTPLSDDVVRVRLVKGNNFGRDHSYAVLSSNLGPVQPTAEIGTETTTLKTATLTVTVQHHPIRLRFTNRSGETLDSDNEEPALTFSGPGFRIAKQLPDDEHIYGLGEKSGRLDKRGWLLGGYNYVMWNTDTYAWDSSTDPLYVTVPFYLATRHGKAHGIFLDTTWRTFFDIGREQRGTLIFGAEGGEANYYFINGPLPKDVIARYTELTGRMPMPPLWSVGYHQCRYSYYPEERVRHLAATFRQKQIPADVIWLDIHYQDNYKPFTWNRDRFPDPKSMIADLAAQGFRVVTIVDPHPNMASGYMPYDTGLAGGFFIKQTNGGLYSGKVWPSMGEHDPAPSVFPDFTMPAARKWWGGLLRGLVDAGVAGIWNDMDEPSVFAPPTGTMALDAVQDNEGQPATHRELHNVYGQLTSRATFEGLEALRPNQRPFVLTRSSFAGGQRYAAVWTGDSTADWASLRQSISTLLGLGVSGFGFVGADIGGFVHPAPAELFTRWLQASVFYPFMRTHTDLGNPDKEPWSFGPRSERINKETIAARYQLLPYIYNALHETAVTGVPAMRPLFVEFPDDDEVAAMDDEFLFGRDLLVAPILWEGATNRLVYLPKGDWFDYRTGKRFEGGRTIDAMAPLEAIPLFVRGGGFIFRQPVVQHTGEMPGNALRVLIAPATDSTATLYEDDGASLDYQHSAFLKRLFHQVRHDSGISVEITSAGGSYVPAARTLELQFWTEPSPKRVSLAVATDRQANPERILPRKTSVELASAAEGWTWDGTMLVVKARDDFGRMRFLIEN
jgi:alpha-glucosidase